MTDGDRRTTPRWLQLPGLLVIAAVVAYDGVAMRYSTAPFDAWPAWLQEHPYSLWPSTWKMFTTRDRTNREMEARVLRADGWEDVDLLELFPSRWESGPRYIRRTFFRDVVNRNTFSQAICRRVDPAPLGVELWLVDWRKTLGQVEQPRTSEDRQLIHRWSCDDEQPLPTGRRL